MFRCPPPLADLNGADRFTLVDGVAVDRMRHNAAVMPPGLPVEVQQRAVNALNRSDYNGKFKSAVSMAVDNQGRAGFYGSCQDLAPVHFDYVPGFRGME